MPQLKFIGILSCLHIVASSPPRLVDISPLRLVALRFAHQQGTTGTVAARRTRTALSKVGPTATLSARSVLTLTGGT